MWVGPKTKRQMEGAKRQKKRLKRTHRQKGGTFEGGAAFVLCRAPGRRRREIILKTLNEKDGKSFKNNEKKENCSE